MSRELEQLIRAAGPAGVTPDALMKALQQAPSRSTLTRQLLALREAGSIKALGNAKATRYVTSSPFTRADIDAYFASPAKSRPIAPFRDEYLEPTANIDPERARRCAQIQALASPMDRKFLAEFVVDFSWGSSLLEGSSYSELDTEALLRYGERNTDKPVEDAVLALNHKRAGEHLWANRELSFENICAMHGLLTDDHGLADVARSDHFLPPEKRGQVRVYEDVNLQNSAYLPPFRPGTRHAEDLLRKIVATAKQLPAVEAAIYLLTRIAYVQSFVNGNKRTSRIAANIPLVNAGLIPFSFVDVNKASYIRGMAAFYELGSMHVIEQTFVQGYVRSIVRSSDLPAALRGAGFDLAETAGQLVDFINTGIVPTDPKLRVFMASPVRR